MGMLNKIFFPLKNFSLKEKLYLFYIILFLFFVTFLDIISIYFLANLIPNKPNNLAFDNSIFIKIISIFNFDKDFDLYKLSIIIFAISIILRNIFSFLQQLLVNKFVYKKYAKYSYELLKTYVLSKPEKFFLKNYSYYLKNVIKETQNAFQGILYAIIYLIVDFFYLISIFVYTFYFLINDFSIELILFLFITFIIIVIFIVKLRKIGIVKTKNEDGVYKDAYETLLSFIEIKLIKHVDLFLGSFKKRIDKHVLMQVIYGAINSLLKPTLEILVSLSVLLFIFFDENIYSNIYNLVILLFLLFRFIPVLTRLSGNMNSISYHYESNEILSKEFKFYSSDKNKTDFKILEDVNLIRLKNLFFKYSKTNNSNEYLFNNFNLTLKKGLITGIYGESGRGKSTLLLIISGLLRSNRGFYFINKKKIPKKKDINWNKKISYMSQSSYLVDDSLKYSLFFDKNSAKEINLINEARILLKKYNLGHLIGFLEDDYLNISLRGTLSMGEKQRIAFIRCILSRPQVLILDEPTASLDEKNERILMNDLLKIKKNCIIIMTTHKKNLIKYFDKTINL
jgi:ABC-type multidrug transport system fused ATPase/permease subunit